MANGVGGPQRNKRVQEFVELCAAAAKRSACGLVLLRRPADTESWQQPTSADHVDTRQLPGELNGWIPRSDEHADASVIDCQRPWQFAVEARPRVDGVAGQVPARDLSAGEGRRSERRAEPFEDS